jgi:8-oxo-dGTP pyrophosphatase MutT (NUDIX family)
VADEGPRRTWDGQEIAPEPPFGATVVVYREMPELEVLLLHRAHRGPDYEGDWAWTPPAGSRWPGEAIDDTARRELREEAGMTLSIEPTPHGTADWVVYVAKALPTHGVRLDDPEHDRYAWLSPAAALTRVRPEAPHEALERAIQAVIAARGQERAGP